VDVPRHSVVRKGGKAHTYWRLVRSVRRGGTVVQETAAQLGELDARGRAQRSSCAAAHRRGDQRELFEARSGGETVAVRLDRVRWSGAIVWQRLARLDALARAQARCRVRRLLRWAGNRPVPVMAAVLVLPGCASRERVAHCRGLVPHDRAQDVLGVPSALVNDDRLYRALDTLYAQGGVETHLKQRLGALRARL